MAKLSYYRPVASKITRFGVVPALYYLVFFILLTWPLVTNFSSKIFADSGDGFQNLWNFWWFGKALSHGQWPYFTTEIHSPYGTSLLGHTLSPLNCLLFNIFHLVVSRIQAFNLVVMFSFVSTGLTTFWLCYKVSRNYLAGLIGGFIFTFSSYHFAHAYGHINLIALEFIPLFLLFWYLLLKQPRILYALFAAISLWLVQLCDFSYVLFCVIAAAVLLAYQVAMGYRDFLKKGFWVPFLIFLGSALALVGPLAIMTVMANRADPFAVGHSAKFYSMDLFDPFVHGQIWKYSALTSWYWHKDRIGLVEASIYLPIGVWLLVLAAFGQMVKRKSGYLPWFLLLIVFYILALGPRLHFFGNTIEKSRLPYAAMTRFFPFLNIGGTPIRMMIIGTLAAAVLSSLVLAHYWKNLRQRSAYLLFSGLTILLAIESVPSTMPTTSPPLPAYVEALKALPAGGVIDDAEGNPSFHLYYQSLYNHPMAFGYISKLQTSTVAHDAEINAAILKGQADVLCNQYHLRYYAANLDKAGFNKALPVYKDPKIKIVDLCRREG